MHWFSDNAILVLLLVIAAFAVMNALLAQRVLIARAAMRQAQHDAEEASRAAAMAAPGGIDPEAVIEVLRRGVPPSLDNVYSAMQRRRRAQAPAPPTEPVSPAVAAPAPPI